MKAFDTDELASGDPVEADLIERVRAAGLAAAQGDAGAARVAVVPLAAGKARRAFLAAAKEAVEADGGRFVAASAGPGEPLAAARSLAKKLAGTRGQQGRIASLARAAAESLETAECWTVVVLDGADLCADATARFWWALARRLSSSGSPALLVALVNPPPRPSPWTTLEGELRGLVRVAWFEPDAPPPSRPGASPRTPAALALGSSQGARTAGLQGGAGAARLSRLQGGAGAARLSPLDPSQRNSPFGAFLDGDGAVAGEFAAAAAEAARAADDLAADATAELATALASAVAEAPEAPALTAAAFAAARLAGDAALLESARLLEAWLHTTAGNDHPARARLHDLDAGALPAELAALAAALSGWLGGAPVTAASGASPVPRGSGPAQAPAGSRSEAWDLLFEAARAEAPADDPRRAKARALFEATGATSTLRTLDLAAAGGMAASGRADSADALAATSRIAGAPSAEGAVTAVLDAALSLVAARGGMASLGSESVARRGSTFLGLPAASRLQAPLRGQGPSRGAIVLERGTSDPPFSRDERRIVEALASVGAARLESAPKREARPPPPDSPDLGAAEREVLVAALDSHSHNLSRTARALGLSRNGLKLKLIRHGMRG